MIDGLAARRGGGITYLANLFAHFDRQTELEVIALVPESSRQYLQTSPAIELLTPKGASATPMHRMAWYRFALRSFLRERSASAIYCPGGLLPLVDLSGWRTAVAFRNMLPFSPSEMARYPIGYLRARLHLLRELQRQSFRRADMVVLLSEYARRVVDDCVPDRRGRSVVIPHGVPFWFDGDVTPAMMPEAPHGYVLYVSILDVYKAQIEVVQAWHLLKKMRETQEKLVFLGPEYPWYGRKVRRLIKQLGLGEDVLILGAIPHAMLPRWYRGAVVNIFASSCENCPNILLEALAAGRPLLSSICPPMPEFGGGAPAYFNPYDPQSLAVLLMRCLDDLDLRKEMGARSASQSRLFSARRMAARSWDALTRLACT